MAVFNEKYEKTNYSTVNACGLAIFFKFLTSVIYLSLSEIPIHGLTRANSVKSRQLLLYCTTTAIAKPRERRNASNTAALTSKFSNFSSDFSPTLTYMKKAICLGLVQYFRTLLNYSTSIMVAICAPISSGPNYNFFNKSYSQI
jgi:hypothetical protein